VSDVERRLRALHEVMREAITSDAGNHDLREIFADAARTATPSAPAFSRNEVAKLHPRQRIIVACDIEGSTTRTNPARAAVRADMYDMFDAALLECEITEDLREPFYDRGDGALALVRPVDGVPKTLLLRTFVPVLSGMLSEHAAIHPDRMFRLRVAIHSGEVHFDQRGAFGEDIDITCRLLDAPELKLRLQQTAAPLVLVVSGDIHRSVIRHGYDGIDGRTFEQSIVLEVAGQRHTGWVHIPEVDRRYGTRDKNAHADRAG
jgi:class 3 adenylate cyclase